jgi:hypothetical protein
MKNEVEKLLQFSSIHSGNFGMDSYLCPPKKYKPHKK